MKELALAVTNANKMRWAGMGFGAFVLIGILLNFNLLGVWAGPVMSIGGIRVWPLYRQCPQRQQAHSLGSARKTVGHTTW